ncbi:hypothetical protein [Amphritea sp. HPY]|uniref:hypothetical protein n=1 Tax=Amphritea sp. HPY TaxID=3421652 RepID=UPI003D7CF09A
MRSILILLSALLLSPIALADCSDEQTWCNTKCEVKHLGDDAAITGCKSKCVAARAACSTKSGAETAVEASKKALKNTESFFKGLTE